MSQEGEKKMSTATGSKRDSLIASGKMGHRVLLFGKKLLDVGGADVPHHENATIDYLPFPDHYSDLERLSKYSIVILGYSAFYGYPDGPPKQKIFTTLMQEALEAGTSFCFVHNSESIPEYNPSWEKFPGGMKPNSVQMWKNDQIGFYALQGFNVRPSHKGELIIDGQVSRSEFNTFLKKWGASQNYFEPFDEYEVDDIISSNEDGLLAFTINAGRGRFIYMPFLRDVSRPKDVIEGVRVLIDSLLTYLAKSFTDIPEWASEPIFEGEGDLRSQLSDLEKKVEEIKENLIPFQEAKAILFQDEYILEQSVTKFFNEHLDIPTERDEQYNEDFWILDENGEQSIICEVKSVVKGFKKSMIYSLYNHRDGHGLDDSFPALLVANCHLQAGSLSGKDRPIDKQDYKVAAQNNILILRVEDLIRLWDAKRQSKVTLDEIMNHLENSKGWLRVSNNLEIKEMN